ncbi:hypothetical protein Q0590_37180 [Rhodocytophaga aerolata]|uniref:Uncharacterized protein n=1 Tax=Rhodocytophaga aerolata TaxID=455078 RepID=A0ABT8RLG9_9BACT|nr:hypothetical protein [Rhodocytophaga aerolata]MDO1451962.1 hypothetical protein [Rhodocytophaga aerolata]
MTKLYLDIDGVLLTKRNTKSADSGAEFVEFVTRHFDCYWLTTHCKGDAQTAVRYLSRYYDRDSLDKLTKVKATDWQTLKTEGIDFSSDFYWIDDAPFESERQQLIKNQVVDRLIIADLNRENELMKVKDQLLTLAKSITGPQTRRADA